jgi:hypothetical protein
MSKQSCPEKMDFLHCIGWTQVRQFERLGKIQKKRGKSLSMLATNPDSVSFYFSLLLEDRLNTYASCPLFMRYTSVTSSTCMVIGGEFWYYFL